MPFCINCDNRHGCKTGLPECLRHNREPGEERLRGRELMARKGMLAKCRHCKDFGICYGPGEYAAALAARQGEGDESSE